MRGRPAVERDEETASRVAAACAMGHSHRVIAKALGMSDHTLRREYPNELKRGLFLSTLEVEAAHFNSAKRGSVIAQIHWLHCKGGWVDPTRQRTVSIDLPPANPLADGADDMTIEVRLKLDTHLRDDGET